MRATWDEVTEIIAAANAYTVKTHGPDRVIGFSPIPAMSMVSYAAGSRYLSLIGGVCMSFYDWYCDLPPACPQTWGEQTDVPESADWYNSGFLILWGSNVPQTRTPDAHFYTEARYKGAKSVVICPDYSEASKFADLWISESRAPMPRSPSRWATSSCASSISTGRLTISRIMSGNIPTCRCWCGWGTGRRWYPTACCALPISRASGRIQQSGMEDRRFRRSLEEIVAPRGSVGFRWGENGKWNLEEKKSDGRETSLQLTFANDKDDFAEVGFPYFGNREHDHFAGTDHPSVLMRKVPDKRVALKDGEATVATVFDLFIANYGLDRGFGGGTLPVLRRERALHTGLGGTITGVPRDQIITVAREFALNAEKTKGRSMVIIGAAMNHWYHCDMNYRGVINMLVMCGSVGQSGGGGRTMSARRSFARNRAGCRSPSG